MLQYFSGKRVYNFKEFGGVPKKLGTHLKTCLHYGKCQVCSGGFLPKKPTN